MQSRIVDQVTRAQSISELLHKRSELGLEISGHGELLREFDLLVMGMYRLRGDSTVDSATQAMLEEQLTALTIDLSTLGGPTPRTSGFKDFLRTYRWIWRKDLSLFLLALIFFLLSLITGWNIALQFPEYALVVLPQGALENIIEHQPWFQNIRNAPFLDGIGIAINNIRVAVYCFLAGSLLGFGGLALLCFNGIFFGTVLGYCYTHGFHQQLTDFVIGHGPLELSIIVASGFASLVYGRTFFERPIRTFPARFRYHARNAGTVALGIVPWLILAATIESMVSPFDYLSTLEKFFLGLLVAASFWYWTFYPHRRNDERTSR